MISFRPTSFTYLVNKRCVYQTLYHVQFILKRLKTLYINFIMKKMKYTLKCYLQQTHTSEKKISYLIKKGLSHYSLSTFLWSKENDSFARFLYLFR